MSQPISIKYEELWKIRYFLFQNFTCRAVGFCVEIEDLCINKKGIIIPKKPIKNFFKENLYVLQTATKAEIYLFFFSASSDKVKTDSSLLKLYPKISLAGLSSSR